LAPQVVIRPFQIGDEEGVVSLLNSVWGSWPHLDLECEPLDHWRWKHLESPLGRSITALAESENEMIGCFHALPLRIKIGDQIYSSTTGVDFVVHPDFRGMKISNKLRDLLKIMRKKAGAKFHFGVTGNPILIQRNIREGNHLLPHEIRKYVRILDINHHLENNPTDKEWMKKYGYHILKIYNKITNFGGMSKQVDDSIEITNCAVFPDEIDHFCEEVEKDFDFIVHRDKRYLDWRYSDHKGGKYIIKLAQADDELLGFCVLRVNRYRSEYPEGFLVDLISKPGSYDIVNSLVSDALSYFDVEGVNIVYCQGNRGHPLEEIYQNFGFLDSRSAFRVDYANWDDLTVIKNVLDDCSADRMHFVLGDYDTI